ncbi:hypothetical protein J6590_036009 [Homalodisca vitripennis]|nr:hypothetical protein J6590_036009 [Homalodisca vitripennis]
MVTGPFTWTRIPIRVPSSGSGRRRSAKRPRRSSDFGTSRRLHRPIEYHNYSNKSAAMLTDALVWQPAPPRAHRALWLHRSPVSGHRSPPAHPIYHRFTLRCTSYHCLLCGSPSRLVLTVLYDSTGHRLAGTGRQRHTPYTTGLLYVVPLTTVCCVAARPARVHRALWLHRSPVCGHRSPPAHPIYHKFTLRCTSYHSCVLCGSPPRLVLTVLYGSTGHRLAGTGRHRHTPYTTVYSTLYLLPLVSVVWQPAPPRAHRALWLHRSPVSGHRSPPAHPIYHRFTLRCTSYHSCLLCATIVETSRWISQVQNHECMQQSCTSTPRRSKTSIFQEMRAIRSRPTRMRVPATTRLKQGKLEIIPPKLGLQTLTLNEPYPLQPCIIFEEILRQFLEISCSPPNIKMGIMNLSPFQPLLTEKMED